MIASRLLYCYIVVKERKIVLAICRLFLSFVIDTRQQTFFFLSASQRRARLTMIDRHCRLAAAAVDYRPAGW